MEDDVFILQEVWESSYEDIMAMPYSRRKRMIYRKEQLELKKRQKADVNSRVRRF